MPKTGNKRYLYSIKGWLSEKRPYPEVFLVTATYVENKERSHESGWHLRPETENKAAIEAAMEVYGRQPSN